MCALDSPFRQNPRTNSTFAAAGYISAVPTLPEVPAWWRSTPALSVCRYWSIRPAGKETQHSPHSMYRKAAQVPFVRGFCQNGVSRARILYESVEHEME